MESEIAFIHRPRLRRKTWTYAELARTSFRFARELETRGIGRGDRVLLWAENSPEWVAAFYGIILRGAIAVPLDEQGSADFAARVCEQTSPKLLLFGSDVDCTHLNFPKLALQDLRRTIAPHSGERYDAESIQAHDTVEIVFTSGTTATPKVSSLPTKISLRTSLLSNARSTNIFAGNSSFIRSKSSQFCRSAMSSGR